jgi:hypothetical protein
MDFLQYKAGAIPGKPLKRKVTPEETRERKKPYEKDRERKSIDSWKQDRRWLHHNVEQNERLLQQYTKFDEIKSIWP